MQTKIVECMPAYETIPGRVEEDRDLHPDCMFVMKPDKCKNKGFTHFGIHYSTLFILILAFTIVGYVDRLTKFSLTPTL